MQDESKEVGNPTETSSEEIKPSELQQTTTHWFDGLKKDPFSYVGSPVKERSVRLAYATLEKRTNDIKEKYEPGSVRDVFLGKINKMHQYMKDQALGIARNHTLDPLSAPIDFQRAKKEHDLFGVDALDHAPQKMTYEDTPTDILVTSERARELKALVDLADDPFSALHLDPFADPDLIRKKVDEISKNLTLYEKLNQTESGILASNAIRDYIKSLGNMAIFISNRYNTDPDLNDGRTKFLAIKNLGDRRATMAHIVRIIEKHNVFGEQSQSEQQRAA